MGLDPKWIEGFWVSATQNEFKEGEVPHYDGIVPWTIDLKLYNWDHDLINEPALQRCEVSFKRVIFRFFTEQDTHTTMLEILPE